MQKKALVIGATGLLGYGVTKELMHRGWSVRAIGKESFDPVKVFGEGIDYTCGDFYDETFLDEKLKGVDKVFFFLSTTFPSTSTDSLELEIMRTLRGLDYLLRRMRAVGVTQMVFPSSGGTVYGNVSEGAVKESDPLKPTTPYGVGKKMCEDIIGFYAKSGISTQILRVGNVYGSPLARMTTQGVIDVFVQKALSGEKATVWGDALTNVRDYIFADDFSEAVAVIGEHEAKGVEVYNLGSGVGTKLEEIVDEINRCTGNALVIEHVQNDVTSSVKRFVLDMSRFREVTGWSPKHDIHAGIEKTVERKKNMIEMF